MPIKVLIADDHVFYREGVRALLGTIPEIEVIGEANHGEEAIALADRVVVMSAGPAARIIGDFPVTLARPRDIAELRVEPEFHHIHKEIWASLRTEVQKAYAQGEGGIA